VVFEWALLAIEIEIGENQKTPYPEPKESPHATK